MALTLNSNLILSGSLVVTGSFETSGSSTFDGTFLGDGSSLTGVTGSWDGNFSGSAVMTGSIDMTGSISATSFSGDGSSLTGVTAEFDGTHTGSASFSGSLEIQGRVTQTGLGESTYFGDQAGEDDDNTTNKNTGFGFAALKENTAGCLNVAVGHDAFKTNTNGDCNVVVGVGALSTNNNGNNNIAIGYGALGNDNSGDENTIVGSLAAIANDTGDRNTAFGFCALFGTHTGNCNTAVGHCAGRFATGSSAGNVFLGHMAGPSVASGDVNNKLYINNTTGSALIEGDFSLDQVTINGSVTSSGAKFTGGDVAFMTGSNGIVFKHSTGKFDFSDNVKLVFGSTDQLEIYKSAGSDSFIDQLNTGVLRMRNAGSNVFSVHRTHVTADQNFNVTGNTSLKLTSITGSLNVSGSGTSLPALHSKTSHTDHNILLESDDTSASSAPDLVLFRNTPIDNQDTLGVIEFQGKNGMVTSSATPLTYNAIYSRMILSGSNQSVLTLSAHKGNGGGATVHAVNIAAIGANNSAKGAVLINPADDFDLPTHTLQVRGDASVSSSLSVSGSSIIFNNLPTTEPTVTGSLWLSGSAAGTPNSKYLMVFNP